MTTRADVETELVARLSGLLTAVSMATTTAGANASLNASIGWAVRIVGGSVASIGSVTNDDIATVPAASLDTFLDLAEYRTRLTIDGNFAKVDTKVGDVEVKYGQLRRGNERAIARLEAMYGAAYGLTVQAAGLTAGTLDLGFGAIV